MTEDQFEKRCAEFDKRLEEMRALLTVAYTGAGAINTNASHVVEKVNEIAQSMHGLTESMVIMNSRIGALQEKADATQSLVKAVAQHLLGPEELRALGLPVPMPTMAKRA
jgi:hypothetical protein